MSNATLDRRSGGFVLISIFAAFALAVLIGLGVWQLQRLSWKEGLIAEISARMNEVPAGIDAVAADRLAGKPIRFRRAQATGIYDHENELHVYAIQDKVQGWRVVTPLKLEDGSLLLVDRGFVPEDKKDQTTRSGDLPVGKVTVTGNIRTYENAGGLFIPDNQPENNKWFWVSISNMFGEVTDKMNAGSHLYILQLESPDHAGSWPRAIKVSPKLSNPHLGYALTWFGLALTLIGVYAAFIVAGSRKKDHE